MPSHQRKDKTSPFGLSCSSARGGLPLTLALWAPALASDSPTLTAWSEKRNALDQFCSRWRGAAAGRHWPIETGVVRLPKLAFQHLYFKFKRKLGLTLVNSTSVNATRSFLQQLDHPDLDWQQIQKGA